MRDQSNTATFIFCLYKQFADPGYRSNLKNNIATIQGMGFEPYIVSNHEELKEDGNLFIKLPDSGSPIQETMPFWKIHNLLMLDNTILSPLDLAFMVLEDDDFKLFTNQKHQFIAIYLRKTDIDWFTFLKTVIIPGCIIGDMVSKVDIKLWVPNDPV